MAWREAVEPVRMERVALVAPVTSLRTVLVEVADAGAVEIDLVTPAGEGPPGEAVRRLQRVRGDGAIEPRLSRERPDLDDLQARGVVDLLAGEAALEQVANDAERRGSVAALTGWAPAAEISGLSNRIGPHGGGLVRLARPPGQDPPTLLRAKGRLHRSFAPLVNTYATVPYEDVDPTVLAGIAYVVMFGMMFADAGHGALLVIGGLLLRAGWPHRLAKLRTAWLFVFGAGVSSVVFGVLFGEFFGPTGVLPVVWLSPLDEPITLLYAAIGVGAVLLAAAYALGVVNRVREGGWRLALVASSGIAGASLFLGLGLLALGLLTGLSWLLVGGAIVAVAGLTLVYFGLLMASGGGAAGFAQATIELFDAVIRLGTNLVSFARLAAFGLTHAALGELVWSGTTTLWSAGGFAMLAAVVLFLVGNAVAFTLEAVIAGIQALRLEYYELFSRVFSGEGRPFEPWHVPTEPARLEPASTLERSP